MKKLPILSLLLVVLLGVTTASAVSLIDVDGDWTGTTGGVNVQEFTTVPNPAYGNNIQNEIRWGTPYKQPYQSGLAFTGVVDESMTAIPITLDTPFEIGKLAHFNYEQKSNTAASQAFMDLNLVFVDPTGTAGVALTFAVNETPGLNTDDIISFPQGMSEIINLSGSMYKFTFVGFGQTPDSLQTEFISPEGGERATLLFAQLSEAPVVPAPGALLLCSLGAAMVGAVRRRKSA